MSHHDQTIIWYLPRFFVLHPIRSTSFLLLFRIVLAVNLPAVKKGPRHKSMPQLAAFMPAAPAACSRYLTHWKGELGGASARSWLQLGGMARRNYFPFDTASQITCRCSKVGLPTRTQYSGMAGVCLTYDVPLVWHAAAAHLRQMR